MSSSYTQFFRSILVLPSCVDTSIVKPANGFPSSSFATTLNKVVSYSPSMSKCITLFLSESDSSDISAVPGIVFPS